MRKFVMLKFTSIIFLLKHSISNSLNPHVNGWWGEGGDGGVGGGRRGFRNVVHNCCLFKGLTDKPLHTSK